MARCACGGTSCNCSVQAGPGVTVSGTGSAANPFVVSAEAPTCSAIRACISAGNGATFSQATGVVAAKASTDPGNLITFGTDSGLYAATDCPSTRQCFSEGNGIDYDPATGIISGRPSADAGNTVTFGGDGGLFVPGSNATVVTACGLDGTGSAVDPLRVATGTWPYPCSIDTEGSVIACDSAGVLRGEPRGRTDFTQTITVTNFADVVAAAGTPVTVLTDNLPISNPDPCRTAFVMVEAEVDVDFTLPPANGIIWGIGGDDMGRAENKGTSSANDQHWQGTKVFRATIPPGGAIVDPIEVRVGGNFAGGSTYSRIQVIHRAFIFVI